MIVLIPLALQPKIVFELKESISGLCLKAEVLNLPQCIEFKAGDLWKEHEIVRFLGVKQNDDGEWCLEVETWLLSLVENYKRGDSETKIFCPRQDAGDE